MGELQHAIAAAHQHQTAQGQGRRGVIPAPVGGWNTQDPEAAMDPSFGTQMENYFPERGRVISRRGSKEYAETTSTSAVETLFNWVSGAFEQAVRNHWDQALRRDRPYQRDRGKRASARSPRAAGVAPR